MKSAVYLFALGFLFASAVSSAQGLRFAGLEKPIDERTSYSVFSERVPKFKDSLEISFDFRIYPESMFGYIFRIKERSGGGVYNLFCDGQGDDLVFKLNKEGHSTLIDARVESGEVVWMKLRVLFDLGQDSVSFSVDSVEFYAASAGLPSEFVSDMDFGRSDYIIDVPSFAIRNLFVSGAGHKRYFFPLDESIGTTVSDDKGHRRGKVSNPEWLMNEYFKWKHVATVSRDSVACAGYDPVSGGVYYFDRKTILFCDVETGNVSTADFEEKCPVRLTLGTNFIDHSSRKIYAYEVWYEGEHMRDTATVASLDLNTMRWEVHSKDRIQMQLHHHGAFFDKGRNRYTIFGGFGNMRYSGSFYSYDLNTGLWYAVPARADNAICPRYFTSLGYENETGKIWLYGGMGNISGEQAVGRKYLYDLYSVDAETGEVQKLWECRPDTDNTVPIRSLVLSGDGYFYTLCYPESLTLSRLQLYRFSIKDGSAEPVADEIPICSDKITTNANLYFDRGRERLVAVVQEFDDDISSTVSIYTLPLSPVSAEVSAIYYDRLRKVGAWCSGIFSGPYIALAVTLLGVGLIVLFLVRRSRRGGVEERQASRKNFLPSSGHDAVYLFGAFEVRSHEGENIAASFTGQQMQLFCLILYYTLEGNGISSRRLSSFLWPGKSEDKVKNSRNVAINYLRKSLDRLSGVSVIHENGHYRLECGEEFYCDYIRFVNILSDGSVDRNADELLKILSRGKFLDFSDDPLFDTFKENVERRAEPFLSSEMDRRFAVKDYSCVTEIADMIFRIDPVDEHAIALLVRALVKLKRLSDARLRYQMFCEMWRSVYDADYEVSFDALCSDSGRTDRLKP